MFYRYVNPESTRLACIETVKKDLALVTIEIVDPDINTFTNDIALSLPDKLGITGRLIE